jgi:pimeloyl-ACP methyl ester carboxylesterase
VYGLEQCSEEKGSGFCPTGNTCCRRADGKSGCVPDDLGSFNATCCNDEHNTGCAVGYECSYEKYVGCVAGENITDPLVQVLPRYHLGHSDRLDRVEKLPLRTESTEQFLHYYSSHGDLTNMKNGTAIRMVLFIIHGAGRNADDYFCAASASVELQGVYALDSVLIVAPHFPITDDREICATAGAACWEEDGSGGPWRYGADAIASLSATNFSSFAVLDQFIDILLNRSAFASVERITIAGHSAGGQFVQRWSLLTRMWDDRFHGVVANPSSYAFLTPLRSIHGKWQLPSTRCNQYNQWEWGVAVGGNYTVPYVDGVLHRLDLSTLIHRFGKRSMYYMVGSQDVCTVPGNSKGWCSSHGLESTCMDRMQGRNRWERNSRYMDSLRLVGVGETHNRIVVPGVGHDHSLMFNSKQGIAAIYGSHVVAGAM